MRVSILLSLIVHFIFVNIGQRCSAINGFNLWNETSTSYQTISERSLMGFRLGVLERLDLDKN